MDHDVDTLTLVLDSIKVKSLYVAKPNSGFAFDSEIMAPLRSGIVEPRLKLKAVLKHLGQIQALSATWNND